MLVSEAFTSFIRYQTAQNKPATIRSYTDRTKTFREGFGNILTDIVDIPPLVRNMHWLTVGHAERPIVDVQPEDIDDWLLVLRNQHTLYVGNARPDQTGGLSRSTLEGRKQSLKHFFAFCEDRGYVLRSPARHIRKAKIKKSHHVRDKVMSLYDFYKIMDVVQARAAQGQTRDLAMLCLMADSGIRPGELINLNVQDIDLVRFEVNVIDGKTGDRTAVCGQHTVTVIARYIANFRELLIRCAPPGTPHTDALFLGLWAPSMGERLHRDAINSLFARLREEANLTGICNPYSIRHMVGDHLAMRAGVPLPLVKEVMGHEDINTTMNYVHPDMSQIKAVVALHSPLNEYFKNKQ